MTTVRSHDTADLVSFYILQYVSGVSDLADKIESRSSVENARAICLRDDDPTVYRMNPICTSAMQQLLLLQVIVAFAC